MLCGLCALSFAAAPPARTPPAVLKLIDRLGDDDSDVRAAAEKKLVAFGEDVVPALRRAANNHDDIDVRLRAAVIVSAIEKGIYREVRQFTGSGDGVGAFALSPDGKRLASGCWGPSYTDSVARVWDVKTGDELLQLKGHESSVCCLAWSPDGKRLLTGGLDLTIRLWDASNGKELLTIEKTHAGCVHAVLVGPDGKKAVSCGGLDRDVVVWDLATGKQTSRIRVHGGAVRGLAWMPGGKRLATACFDGHVRIVDVETGKEVRKMDGHRPAQAWFVAVSPDGKRIASSGSDAKVRLFDARTGKQLKEFSGHTQGVHGIAYSRDGRRLLSCAESARLWSVESGKELQRIEAPARVTCIAFLADDGHAIFSCYDKTLRLWKVRR
jgi:WD40 repeat protein